VISKFDSVLFTVFLAAFVSFGSGVCFDKAHAIAHKMVAEGGPYVCVDSKKLIKKTATLNFSDTEKAQPLFLTFYNGYGGRYGYNWVRVFLESGSESGESGQVLVDESTFRTQRAVTVDITGRVPQDGAKLFIEGQGRKDAIFSWVLTTTKDSLSLLNATKITPGNTCLLHGTGFSANANEMKVLMNGKPCDIISAMPKVLQVRAPKNLKGKHVSVQVTVNGKSTNLMQVAMNHLPPVLYSMSPYGGPVGGLLNIRGANFSRIPNQNIVNIGPYRANVVNVMDDGTLICRIPEWSGSGTLPVTVITGGVPSRNHLNFWCVPHYYGGDPNAAQYGGVTLNAAP